MHDDATCCCFEQGHWQVTRRVNLTGIWQACYTAGVVLPKPITVCRYWHRSLNPKKLIDVDFSRLAPRMNMKRTKKLYEVAENTQVRTALANSTHNLV